MSVLAPPADPSTGAVFEPYKEDLNNIMICLDCKEDPPNLVEEFSSGDMVCGSCGLVLGARIIDTRSEWRTFSNDDQGNDDPSRVGDAPNALLDGDQLETAIAYGQVKSKNARDLTRAQNKIMDKTSKALMAAYREIGTLCDKISTGKTVADAAKLIFKQVEEAKFLKGKNQDAVIAGCIFIACRQLKVPRTFREIFSLTNVPKKDIGRIFKQLETFLGKNGYDAQNLKQNQQVYNHTASTTAKDLCARFIDKLRFRDRAKAERVASELATRTGEQADLAGRSPLSIAAACIYMASALIGDQRGCKDIAKASGVSEGTVKTAYRYLLAAREGLFAGGWLGKDGDLEKLPPN